MVALGVGADGGQELVGRRLPERPRAARERRELGQRIGRPPLELRGTGDERAELRGQCREDGRGEPDEDQQQGEQDEDEREVPPQPAPLQPVHQGAERAGQDEGDDQDEEDLPELHQQPQPDGDGEEAEHRPQRELDAHRACAGPGEGALPARAVRYPIHAASSFAPPEGLVPVTRGRHDAPST